MFWWPFLLAHAAGKEQDSLQNTFGQRQVCGGVYGPQDAHGPFEPAVNISFPRTGDTAGEFAVLVYDYADIDSIGFMVHEKDQMFRKYMCDQTAVYNSHCSASDLGKFIVSGHPAAEVLNEIIKIDGDDSSDAPAAETLHYKVERTGFYCIAVQATPGHENMKFNVNVGFQNAYGHLPGSDYPLILFHFVQGLVYVAVLLVWLVPLVMYRHSLLKVQYHLTALCSLMVVEQLCVSAYYYVTNRQGHAPLPTFLLVLSSLLASGRLAYTFFMLLIVAHGYSVVHPSLGSNMRKAQLLAGGVFALGFAYSVLDYYTSEETSARSWLPFATDAVFLPFIGLLSVCYFITLRAMRETLAYLSSRKQAAKVQMYRFVVFVLMGSLIAIALQLVVLVVQFFVVPVKSVINSFWRSQWVVYDGWPNIVYCVALVLIMVLWRPNRDNMRYAMSTQLSQNENDADEFEIGSLNGSDDDLEIPTNDEYFAPRGRDGRTAEFDAGRDHDLSDLETEFEVRHDDRFLPDDEDALVSAPTQRPRKNR